MTKDEALELALEALEGCHTSDKPMHQFFNKPKTDKAITAIKEALAQNEPCSSQGLVSEAMAQYIRVSSSGGMPRKLRESVQSLVDDAERLGYFKALAQPEQEPVGWDVHTEHCFQGEYKHCCKYGDGDDCTAAPKTQWNPEPEPLTVDVVYVEGDDLFICGVHGKITVVALSEIERDIKENPDFLKGDGVYSYSVTRFDGEYGFEGRCELAPCWELCESGYVPL